FGSFVYGASFLADNTWLVQNFRDPTWQTELKPFKDISSELDFTRKARYIRTDFTMTIAEYAILHLRSGIS
ncbi:15889_t:CDS:1, partial [Cetraspora pellucida]